MASIITPCVTARLDAVFKVLFRTGEAQPICDRDALPSRWRTSRSLHKSCEGASQLTGTPISAPRESCAGRRHRSSPFRLPQARCPGSALPSPTALVDPVGWLMFLSKTIWVRQHRELAGRAKREPALGHAQSVLIRISSDQAVISLDRTRTPVFGLRATPW
jgi:hypothetical protein